MFVKVEALDNLNLSLEMTLTKAAVGRYSSK